MSEALEPRNISPIKDSEATPLNPGEITWYDLTNEVLVVGEHAYENYLEAGGHPTDIIKLETLLTNDSIPLPFVYRKKEPKTTQELLEYGHWLYGIVSRPEDRHRQRLNKSIIIRAARLGIGPSVWEIENNPEIGSITQLYKQMDAVETKHNSLFEDWSFWDYASYISELTQRLGRKPNREDLRAEAYKSLRNPHPESIEENIGSLRQAYELAGFPNVHAWGPRDYIDWGVKVMMVNGGEIPSQSEIDRLSRKGVGPSASSIANHFNRSISGYQKLLRLAYDLGLKRREQNLSAQKQWIERQILGGVLPTQLRVEESVEETMLKVQQYNILSYFLPSAPKTLRTQGAVGCENYGDIVREIISSCPTRTVKEIDEYARQTPYFEMMVERAFMERLRALF